jgi:transcriptional regulator with XRE-family HTH domain
MIKHEKNLKMRELRKAFDPPFTLKELARQAGVSYSTVWNLENGYDEMVKPGIMQKVCEILGAEPLTLFPSEMARWNQYSARYGTKRAVTGSVQSTAISQSGRVTLPIKEQGGIDVLHHHRFFTLIDICPSLDFESERDVEQILRQMTPDELRNLYHFCSNPEKAVIHLNRTAKKLGLTRVKLRK